MHDCILNTFPSWELRTLNNNWFLVYRTQGFSIMWAIDTDFVGQSSHKRDKLNSNFGFERVRTFHHLPHLYTGGSYCSGLPQVLETHTSAELQEQSCSPPTLLLPYNQSHSKTLPRSCTPSPALPKFYSNYWIKVQRNVLRWVPCNFFFCAYTSSGAQKTVFIQCQF